MASELFEQSSFLKKSQPTGPVECLGLTFENDAARRSYFLEKLRQKLQDPEFRKIEGFPIGSDEDILKLSDPPYYVACPNPFLEDFIRYYGKPYDPSVTYHKEPFAADISEGKNDSIYNAHSYHTKVPHKAIMRYILHYTQPGDLVFDGFCGSGMTGVAAQLCGSRQAIQDLGYSVDDSGNIFDNHLLSLGNDDNPVGQLGARHVILNDLSPVATFLAFNYSNTVDLVEFESESKKIVEKLEEECGWMYETVHTDGKRKGEIVFTIWSDVYICSVCNSELVYWDVAVNPNDFEVKETFTCPACKASLKRNELERAWETIHDETLGLNIERAKKVPAYMEYLVQGKKYSKKPSSYDLELLAKIQQMQVKDWFPTYRMPVGDESRRNDNIGIGYIHQYYTKRNLHVISKTHSIASYSLPIFEFGFLNTSWHGTLMRRFNARGGHRPLSGTLYLPPLSSEGNILKIYKHKINQLNNFLVDRSITRRSALTTTQSITNIPSPTEICDYIFLDPPFGSNISYSDLNFLWESWLRVFTNNKSEAVVSPAQKKGLPEYQQLMEQSFEQCYKLLKPGRWLTLEFHNSKNSVWVAIQEALTRAGFIIADVRTLDKQQGSFKQVTSAGAVKQDLIITAYRPNKDLEERFELEAGTEEGAWDFVRTHLRHLPILVSKGSQIEYVAERQNYMLYDRMIAFHVQRNKAVPLSAGEFYSKLDQNFPKRDGMYFLPDQVIEFDRKRLTAKQVEQLQFIVNDEASAILWLRQQLEKYPQTYQELFPKFLKELSTWQKHEKALELGEILEQNFLRYDGHGQIPAQIVSWLQQDPQQYDLTNEDFSVPSLNLRTITRDRWYIPDPNRAQDLERIREKTLLKEFEAYQTLPGRLIKVFRIEAVRAGFRKAWQEKDYQNIIRVADKLPEDALLEDPLLVMWYDQAMTRLGYSNRND